MTSLVSLLRVAGASSSINNNKSLLLRLARRKQPTRAGVFLHHTNTQQRLHFFSTTTTPHLHPPHPLRKLNKKSPLPLLRQQLQPQAPVLASLLPFLWHYRGEATQCEHEIFSYPASSVSSASSEFPTIAARPSSSSSSKSSSFRQKIRRAVRMVLRFLKLSLALAPVTLCYPILLLTNNNNNKKQRDVHDVVLGNQESNILVNWYLRLCLHCVEFSGAAVIKLMQWAGSRPDLFGHSFCSVFSQLQDRARPHSWRHTVRVMKQDFGDDWAKRIVLRRQDILGSGCIGQVYRGQVLMLGEEDGLHTTDGSRYREVAIKVLHPNVEEDIDADLDLMRFAVKVVEWLPFEIFSGLKWLNLEGIVEEFASLLKLQLDLRHEGRNLERFNVNFKDDESVVFPKLIPGYEPQKNVLIETFCEGIPVLQFARENANDRELLHKMCLTAIHTVCKMIFLHNLVHGDLHPGNVYVSRDGKKFILFDVGIVAEYSDKDHQNIVSLLAAFVRKQGRKAGRLMIDESNNRLRAASSKAGDEAAAALDEERYIDKIELLTIRASSKDYLMEHLGSYISYFCEAARQHHVMMNPSFMSAALAVKVQEGIALALDPSVKISKVASPIVIESELRLRTVDAGRRLTRMFTRFFGKKEDKMESLSS